MQSNAAAAFWVALSFAAAIFTHPDVRKHLSEILDEAHRLAVENALCHDLRQAGVAPTGLRCVDWPGQVDTALFLN